MDVNYNKLWKLLIDKNMTKTDLRIKADMSTATLAKMSKNEIVSMDILLRICRVLECNVGDIIDVINSDRAWGDYYGRDRNWEIYIRVFNHWNV